MNLLREDLINYWYFWILAVFFFGSVAFASGFVAVENKKNKIKCLLPMLCLDLLIVTYLALNVSHWIKMGASFHWVIYEHGPKVYITVIAFVCILIGYLAGMAFARKKA